MDLVGFFFSEKNPHLTHLFKYLSKEHEGKMKVGILSLEKLYNFFLSLTGLPVLYCSEINCIAGFVQSLYSE